MSDSPSDCQRDSPLLPSASGRLRWFVLGALFLVVPNIAAFWWLATNYWEYEDLGTPTWLRAMNFWGGNPNEVYSHWVNMWACSGVNACLMYLLALEAALRRDTIGWTGAWSLGAATIVVPFAWVGCALLDARHGEFGLASLIVYVVIFLPFLTLPFLLCASHLAVMPKGVLPCLLAAVVFVSQLCFEPSGTGGPNDLVLWLFIPFAILACIAIQWRYRRFAQALRSKGYDLQWRQVAFIALNVDRPARIPPREELAVLPHFDHLAVELICSLAHRGGDKGTAA